MATLADQGVGFSGVVRSLVGDSLLIERLAEFGVVPGCTVVVGGMVAFGDPILVQVGGMRIALRRTEARCVLVN
jgi:ferrous iron transport protein A